MRVLLLLLPLLAATAHAQCSRCSSATNLATYTDADPRCCHMCPPGFACNGTTATPCRPPDQFQSFNGQTSCRTPRNCTAGTFEALAPTASADRVCRALSLCNNQTEFERIAPTATSDRVCTLTRICSASSEYELAAPTATSDRVCRQVSSCNLLTQQVAAPATPTSDTVCKCRPNFIGTPCSLCENVITGCNYCHINASNFAVCDECLLAYQPAQTEGGYLRCVRCTTQGCAECDEFSDCVRCREGFTLSQTGACVCSVSGCAVCGLNGTCETCATGFERSANSTCAVATTTTSSTSSATSTTTTLQTTTTATPAAAVNLSAKSSNLLTIAVVGACVGSLAMVAVVGVVAAGVRRRRRTREAPPTPPALYESPITVLPNGSYAEPVTLFARNLQISEPIYDIATTDGYLEVGDENQ
jgi:hypothetical protein